MKKVGAAALVLVLWLGLGRASSAWPDVREVDHKTYVLSAAGDVAVENSSGDVEVIGWDRNEVDLTATKTAWSHDDLSRMQAVVNATPTGFGVRAVYPNDCSNCDLSLVLRVPRGARVTLRTSSGDVKAESITGAVRAESSSGDVGMTNVAGEMHLIATSGDINIDGSRGTIEAVASSGSIDASRLDGSADLVASSGDVSADFDRFDGVKTIRLESSSGDISLKVPRGAGFVIQATAVNGSIDSNLRLPIHERDSGADVAAQVGDGKVTAQLKTTSGDIDISMH